MSRSDEQSATVARRDAFVARYGGVYEHSPWVAETVFEGGPPHDDVSELQKLFEECVDNASREQRMTLIRAHPDLAGRAAVVGELTKASTVEQSSAGIDQCSPEEFDRFQRLNERYKRKFLFPFVMAVRNSNRHSILAAFEDRLANDARTEFETAIAEIHKIARMRFEALQEQ